MTTKHRRHIARVFAPRPVGKPWALGTDYGRDQLDNELVEIQPRHHRDANADDPWLSPHKSAIVRECLIRIEFAAAHTPLLESEQQRFDLRGLCQDAELTDPQTDVLCLVAEGWTQRQIASWLDISQTTVWRHWHHGRSRLAGWLPLLVVSRLDSVSLMNQYGAGETRPDGN